MNQENNQQKEVKQVSSEQFDQARQSKSPTPAHIKEAAPKQQEVMTFQQAVKPLIDGKRIARLEWPKKEEYGVLQDGYLKIYREGKMHNWLVSDGDLMGEDWVIHS